MRLTLYLILAFALAVALLVGLFIYGITTMGGGGGAEYLAASTAIALPFLAASICCSIAMDRHRLPRLMRTGLYAAIIAWPAWLVVVWGNDYYIQQSLSADKVAIWPSMWTGLMALIGLLSLPQVEKRWWRALRLSTVVLLCLLAFHIAASVTLFPIEPATGSNIDYNNYYARRHLFDEYASRIGVVIGLFSLAGLSASFLLLWLVPQRRGEFESTLHYWIICPRCESEQTMHTGWDRCTRCGLEVCVD